MSDVRSAAERMRAWLALPEPKGVTDRHYSGGVGQYETDSEILVNSYLAEHLADENEPVTIEWLESIGFKLLPSQYDGCQEWTMCGAGGRMNVFVSGLWKYNLSPVPAPRTRGDVRRLLRALGVEFNS